MLDFLARAAMAETAPMATSPAGRRKPEPPRQSSYYVNLLGMAFLAELEPEVVRARSLGI